MLSGSRGVFSKQSPLFRAYVPQSLSNSVVINVDELFDSCMNHGVSDVYSMTS